MTALDWITTEGRFVRNCGAIWLRRQLSREPKTCTWCGNTCPKGRSRWCSDACVQAFRERCDTGYITRMVKRRDQGICAICGLDTEAVQRFVRKARRCFQTRPESLCCHAGRGNRRGRRNQKRVKRLASIAGFSGHLRRWLERRGFSYHLSFWQADHIVPVVEGGGLCGLDGYRTVCLPCHKLLTAELRKRLANGRVDEKMTLFADVGAP